MTPSFGMQTTQYRSNSSPDPFQRTDLKVDLAGKHRKQHSSDLIYHWITQSPGSVTKDSQPLLPWVRELAVPIAVEREGGCLLISLMGYCFLCEWMAEHEIAQQELHALEMRQKHKSIPCLKITLLRIETETHTQACTHARLWGRAWSDGETPCLEDGLKSQNLQAGKSASDHSL